MTIKNKFHIKQQVFLKTDPEQYPRFITGIEIRDVDHFVYLLTGGTEDSTHYEYELSSSKNYTFGQDKTESHEGDN
ncbi:MAG TPA: hypothetical protein PK951_10965 [Chitinophagaceae bacterium]|nr:hypothetical protein [Chitinophagaceae bacterium]